MLDQLFKLPRLSLGKQNEYAIRFNPGGKFNGWLYVKRGDYWVGVHKLNTIDPAEALYSTAAMLLAKKRQEGGDAMHEFNIERMLDVAGEIKKALDIHFDDPERVKVMEALVALALNTATIYAVIGQTETGKQDLPGLQKFFQTALTDQFDEMMNLRRPLQ